MAYSDTFIVIHLVKDSNVLNLDDTIHIVKNLDDDTFELTYKDSGDSLRHKAYQMRQSHVYDYISLLLKNLSLDEDGYQKVQFSLPAMPRVIVNASNLKDEYYRDHFLDLIETGLTMLDKVEKLATKKPAERDYTSCHPPPCNLQLNSTHFNPYINPNLGSFQGNTGPPRGNTGPQGNTGPRGNTGPAQVRGNTGPAFNPNTASIQGNSLPPLPVHTYFQ